MALTYDRAEQIAKSINAVQETYLAEIAPDSWQREGAYCVSVSDPWGETDEVVYVIDEWNGEAREWLQGVITAELSQWDAPLVGDAAGDGQ